MAFRQFTLRLTERESNELTELREFLSENADSKAVLYSISKFKPLSKECKSLKDEIKIMELEFDEERKKMQKEIDGLKEQINLIAAFFSMMDSLKENFENNKPK